MVYILHQGGAEADCTCTYQTVQLRMYAFLFPQTFQYLGLNQDYRLLSTSKDDDDVEYVSTVEHRTLPFYGVQWHPEKNLFEWSFSSIPHTRPAIRAAQYIANFFVEQGVYF